MAALYNGPVPGHVPEPDGSDHPAQLGRCYRARGDLDRARALLLESLEARPSSAPSHRELAKIYRALDRPADAIHHLERALETWEPADPWYGPAAEARALLAELRRDTAP